MANQIINEEYWMYLRKSRADVEAEERGEGETLARHKNALFKLAKDMNVTVTKVFSEVVSGESIFHRPEMTQMLDLMKQIRPKGVLVMDIDRLGRGDKIDQGTIELTFKECKTLIITPSEIFDMNDESGEFSVEVRSFLSRFEYKQSKKRLQGGRISSLEEGNYISTYPPYGYDILKIGKRDRTLILKEDQAPAVKLIFDWYTHDNPEARMGANKIAHKLNDLGYRTYYGKLFDSTSVINILKNHHYAGYVRWRQKETKKSRTPGKKRDTKTRPKSEWLLYKGKHQPIITVEKFNKAQEILKTKYHVPYQLTKGITNPLAGLIKCDICGASMVLRPHMKQQPHLICYKNKCPNKSTRFAYVEERLIQSLKDWLVQYKSEWDRRKPSEQERNLLELKETGLRGLERELQDLEGQKEKLYDLLERGVYTEETFLHRSQNISERITNTRKAILIAQEILMQERIRVNAKRDIIPTVEKVLDSYSLTNDPALKNHLLKSVLDSAVYRKEKHQQNDDFTLILYPKLPQNE